MELSTFAEHLRNIALSIDIVNDATLSRIQFHAEGYMKSLGINFFEFLTPQIVNKSDGLQTQWHSGGEKWSQSIKNEEEKYKGQISYAFDLGKKLCIVSEEGKHLSIKTNKFMNLWNSKKVALSNIPEFISLTDKPIYASIMIPTYKENGERQGIFNFEFGKGFEYTIELQKELELFTNSLSTLFELNKAHRTQRKNTEIAISTLSDLNKFSANFKRPRVFVASANEADKSVIECIEKVLHEFKNELSVIHWYEIDKSGNISNQILESISSCSFGICYFSEKSVDTEVNFLDNPNVLFEAGMIHGLSRISINGPKNWIPIRESEKITGSLPFDLVTERILEVPRDHQDLDKRKFEMDLKNKIRKLLDENY